MNQELRNLIQDVLLKHQFRIYEFHTKYPEIERIGVEEFWKEIDGWKVSTLKGIFETEFNIIEFLGEEGITGVSIKIDNKNFSLRVIIKDKNV